MTASPPPLIPKIAASSAIASTAPTPMRQRPLRTFGFYLAPQFSMISLMCTIEPLRVANEILGRDHFSWELISKAGERVRAVNGLDLQVHKAMADIGRFDALAVCASYDLPSACEPQVLAWLRNIALQGSRLGAIDTGSYILAKAGLLNGYRCTIHWQNLEALTNSFPHVRATSNLYEIDRNRFSCGGATAALDMMLHLISTEYGADLAGHVSEQLIYARLRQDHNGQRSSVEKRLQVRDPRLGAALVIMEREIEHPLPITEIADMSGITVRRLQRLFEQHFDCSPARYYADIRLKHANTLLQQTSLPMLDIAVMCGFSSYAHFSRSYKSYFGYPPRMERHERFQRATQ